jgi:putative salt-induced outer membrane protein YdiY
MPGEPERTGDFTGRVNLSMRSERGNTDSDDVGADVDLTYRRNIHRLRVLGELEEDRKDGEKTKQNWLIGFTYNYFVTKKLYFTGSLKFEQDEFANLDLRTSAGPYVGYQFFESRHLNLLAEAGAILVREDYSTESDNAYWGPGWHISFDTYVFSDRLQFYHEQFGLFNAEDADNWLWKSWTGVRVPLFGGLVGSAEAKFDYDGEPSEDTEGTQTTYRLKLGYRW